MVLPAPLTNKPSEECDGNESFELEDLLTLLLLPDDVPVCCDALWPLEEFETLPVDGTFDMDFFDDSPTAIKWVSTGRISRATTLS